MKDKWHHPNWNLGAELIQIRVLKMNDIPFEILFPKLPTTNDILDVVMDYFFAQWSLTQP
jgi:hypothetical protein